MRHPSMTARGQRIAFVIAVLGALALPKKQPCSFPGEQCSGFKRGKQWCTANETEPFGVYLLESVLRRDLGITYGRELDCY